VSFEAFRPELVADAVRQPELAVLVGKARVRRRRRTLAALAVAVLVLTGALSVLDRPGRGAEPVQPAPRHEGSRDVVFVDAHTIVEVLFTSCSVRFSVSGDEGRGWSPYRGPTPCDRTEPAHPVGYQVFDANTWLTTIAGQWYLTMDAGLSWRTVSTDPVHVEGFNSRALLCQPSCTGRSAVQAVDPLNAKVYELEATSGLPTLSAVRGTSDGAIWLVGRDMHGAPTVGWSVDHGRTWGTKALPYQAVEQMVLAACTARTAYLLLAFDPDAVVFATTDGGLTWEQHTSGVPTSGDPKGAFCAPDGGLVMATNKEVWVSHDRGATFARAGTNPSDVVGSGRGLLWTCDEDARYAIVTVDGQDWRRMSLNPE
jgi:hypothetical protein